MGTALEQRCTFAEHQEGFGILVVAQLNMLAVSPCCGTCCAACQFILALARTDDLEAAIACAPEHLRDPWLPWVDRDWLRSQLVCQSRPVCESEGSDAERCEVEH